MLNDDGFWAITRRTKTLGRPSWLVSPNQEENAFGNCRWIPQSYIPAERRTVGRLDGHVTSWLEPRRKCSTSQARSV